MTKRSGGKLPEEYSKYSLSIKHEGTEPNSCRTTWKTVDASYLRKKYGGGTRDAVRALQGSFGSSRGALGRWTTLLHSVWGLETNMPWSELRAWFRNSDVIFPKDYILTNPQPTWELFAEKLD